MSREITPKLANLVRQVFDATGAADGFVHLAMSGGPGRDDTAADFFNRHVVPIHRAMTALFASHDYQTICEHTELQRNIDGVAAVVGRIYEAWQARGDWTLSVQRFLFRDELGPFVREGRIALGKAVLFPGLESHGPSPTESHDDDSSAKVTKTKRSTRQGDARAKLIAALTSHHQYAKGGCLNLEPIGSNELARQASKPDSVISTSTTSTFFKKHFGGYAKYRVKCRDAGSLADALKALRGEFTPAELTRRLLENAQDVRRAIEGDE